MPVWNDCCPTTRTRLCLVYYSGHARLRHAKLPLQQASSQLRIQRPPRPRIIQEPSPSSFAWNPPLCTSQWICSSGTARCNHRTGSLLRRRMPRRRAAIFHTLPARTRPIARLKMMIRTIHCRFHVPSASSDSSIGASEQKTLRF